MAKRSRDPRLPRKGGPSRQPAEVQSDLENFLGADESAATSLQNYLDSVALVKRGELYRKLVIDLTGDIVRDEHTSAIFSERLLTGAPGVGEKLWAGLTEPESEEEVVIGMLKTPQEVKEFVQALWATSHEHYQRYTVPYRRRRRNHHSSVIVHACFIPLSLRKDRALSHFIVSELVDFRGSQ